MFEGVTRLIGKLRRGETDAPSLLCPIDADHVDIGPTLGGPFVAGEHYFTIRVNEMFLQYSRRWYVDFLPMTWVLTQYTRDYGVQELPCMVGPSLIGNKAPSTQLPEGMLFRDVRVAGVQPYRGGPISLSMILYQVPQANHAEQLLSALSSAAGAFDFAGQLTPYLKVLDAMSDTASQLLDIDKTKAVLGSVHELDPNAGDLLRPGYYVMLSDGATPKEKLWVKEGSLLMGDALATASPVRTSDYVLYSIMQTSDRNDAESLTFIEPLWKRIVQFAGKPDDQSWLAAKANMGVLGEELRLSADLTVPQAERLYDGYLTEMLQIRSKARELADYGAAAAVGSPEERDLMSTRAIFSQVFESG